MWDGEEEVEEVKEGQWEVEEEEGEEEEGQDQDGSERDQKLIDDARLGQSLLSPETYQLVRILW